VGSGAAQNLLSNSIKYRQPGIAPRIGISAAQRANLRNGANTAYASAGSNPIPLSRMQ
jgi:hypothetical protein